MRKKHVNPHGPSLDGTKICAKCLEVKSAADFYADKVNKSGYRPYCKICDNKASVERYRSRVPKRVYERKTHQAVNAETLKKRSELKRKMVELLGGKCFHCGYAGSYNALDFHHISDKEGRISDMILRASRGNGRQTELLMAEIRKCVVLCSNCHRELHAGDWQLPLQD
jgi:hypothetical protein